MLTPLVFFLMVFFNTPFLGNINSIHSFWLFFSFCSTTVYGNIIFLLFFFFFVSFRWNFFSKSYIFVAPVITNALLFNDISCRLISFNLYSGAVSLHPHLVYSSYIMITITSLIFFYFYKPDFFKILLLFRLILTLITVGLLMGGLWGATGVDWGAWWTWDIVEYPPLIIMLLITYYLHYPRLTLSLRLISISLIIVLSTVIFLRLGLLLTKHSFFKSPRLFFDMKQTKGLYSYTYTPIFYISPAIFFFFKNKPLYTTYSKFFHFFFIFFVPFLAYLLLSTYTYKLLFIFLVYCLCYTFTHLYLKDIMFYSLIIHITLLVILLCSYPFFIPHRYEVSTLYPSNNNLKKFLFFNINNITNLYKYNDHLLFSSTFSNHLNYFNPTSPLFFDFINLHKYPPKTISDKINEVNFSFNHVDFFYTNGLFSSQTRPSSFTPFYSTSWLDFNYIVTIDPATSFLYFLFYIIIIFYLIFFV